jgi:O-antigen/teichoic acid export membrane protein
MSLKKIAAVGTKWTASASLLSNILKFAQLPIIARILAPQDFGLMAMVMVVTGFASSFSDMGVSCALVCRKDTSRNELSTLYWFNILSSILVFLLVNIATLPLVTYLWHEPRLERLIRWTSLIFLILPLGQQFQFLLQKELKFKIISLIDLTSDICAITVALVTAFLGQGVMALVWSALAAAIIRTILLCVFGFRRWKPTLYFRIGEIRWYLRFGAYQMGERILNFLGWNLDKVLIGSLLGAQQLGLYNIAYQLMSKPFLTFNPIVTRVAFPVFSQVQNDNKRLIYGYLEIIKIISLVMFPVYVMLIALADPIVQVLFGPQWLPAADILRVISILGFIYAICNPIGSLLLAKGRADIGFYMNVVVIMLYGASIFIGYHWGIVGIAWGLVLSTTLLLFPLDFLVRWLVVRMSPWEFIKSFGPILMSATLGGVLAFTVKIIIPHSTGVLLTVFSAITFGTAVYLILAFFLEKKLIFQTWKLLINKE